MTVLILSSLSDVHARAVMAALAKHKVQVELLDLAEYPTKLTLTLGFEGASRQFVLKRPSKGMLDLDAVHAVWWRRPGAFGLPAALRDASHRSLALSEANTAFQGLYAAMHALWINSPALDTVAGHKPYQLAVSQSLDLEIPPTRMTSDPEEARAFWKECDGDVIYKQFLALPETWAETRKLGKAEIGLSDSAIQIAPVIFQRHIAAVADLRVTIIGDEIFAASTDVRNLEYATDVRLNLDTKYVAHDLPDEIADKLRALMRRLGLVYGAIDLRLTEDGRYVFLEINPAGQFLYIEHSTGQPIAAALASRLAAG